MSLALANPPSLGVMYGVENFYEGCKTIDYNPWAHAEALGAQVVSNMTLPVETPAAYSCELDVIFFRADLPEDVEYSAITHELVHFENKDDGLSQSQEDRADRIAALRLIRPSRLADELSEHGDIAEAARNLRVTERLMSLYLRMARNGTLPNSF